MRLVVAIGPTLFDKAVAIVKGEARLVLHETPERQLLLPGLRRAEQSRTESLPAIVGVEIKVLDPPLGLNHEAEQAAVAPDQSHAPLRQPLCEEDAIFLRTVEDGK